MIFCTKRYYSNSKCKNPGSVFSEIAQVLSKRPPFAEILGTLFQKSISKGNSYGFVQKLALDNEPAPADPYPEAPALDNEAARFELFPGNHSNHGNINVSAIPDSHPGCYYANGGCLDST